MLDHPIFIESIQFIRDKLGSTGLDPLEQEVLERMIHTSGDFEIRNLVSFSPGACHIGLTALQKGANILVDTSMAREAIKPMSNRTIKVPIHSVLDWAPLSSQGSMTRTAIGIERAWKELAFDSSMSIYPIVVIGSSPTALESLLDLVGAGMPAPSLIIGMPVGFIGVQNSKERLLRSTIPYVVVNGTKGGASLASSVINALLRALNGQ